MPELSPHAAPADRRSGRRRGRSARNTGNATQVPAKAKRNLATEKGLRSRIRLLVVTPVTTVSVLAAGTWSTWYFVENAVATWSAAGAAAVIGVGTLVATTRKATAISTAVHEQRVTNATSARQWVERFEAVTAEGQKSIAQLLEQISRGERPQLMEPAPHAVSQGNPFADLEQTLRLAQHQALAAVAEAGARQQVDVFVNIAQRLHALVNRALARLDDLESEVEDPDLLGGLFGVDHLVTQFRRQVESLAVMGGAVPRRINKPVPLPTVLRQGVAEIEQYARVRVIQPPEGTLPGYAAAEVIHLLAELVENAARFSAPETQVTLRAERVPAGLAIEIDDRGLPMAPEKLDRMNRLLTRPDQFDIREQLEDGRIGLFVVAQIARRHDIEVALRRNIYGGTQAVVVLPNALLDAAPPQPVQRETDHEQRRQPDQAAEHAQRTEPSHEPSSGAAWSHQQPAAQQASPQTPAHTAYIPQQASQDSPYQAPSRRTVRPPTTAARCPPRPAPAARAAVAARTARRRPYAASARPRPTPPRRRRRRPDSAPTAKSRSPSGNPPRTARATARRAAPTAPAATGVPTPLAPSTASTESPRTAPDTPVAAGPPPPPTRTPANPVPAAPPPALPTSHPPRSPDPPRPHPQRRQHSPRPSAHLAPAERDVPRT